MFTLRWGKGNYFHLHSQIFADCWRQDCLSSDIIVIFARESCEPSLALDLRGRGYAHPMYDD